MNSDVVLLFISKRTISLRFKISRGFLTVVVVYAPEEGRKNETIEFYEKLQKTIDKYPNDQLIIADLNARVGNQPITKIIGTQGEVCLNENGRELRDFATFNSLKITNTFFHKKNK